MTRIICAVPVLFLISTAYALDPDEGDLWQRTAFEIPIEDLKLKLHNENRFNDRAANFQRTHFEGALEIPLPWEGFSIEPTFRYIIIDGEASAVIEYDANLNYKKKDLFGSDWDLHIRNRWEYVDLNPINDHRYQTRLKIKLSHPTPIKAHDDKPVSFWIFEELFYKFWMDDFGENRLGAGFTIPVFENTAISLGGQWRTRKNSTGWDDTYQALIGIKYKFPKGRK